MNTAIKNRYNLFNLIHKGIRVMLNSTGISLQQNDFRNLQETVTVFKEINEVLLICNDHTSHENKFILLVIAKYNLVVVRDIENQHLIEETLAYRL